MGLCSINKFAIEKNKINNVVFKWDEPVLQFAYSYDLSAPSEYKAIINKRFSANQSILQNCSEKKQYSPGTYYIVINTLPESKFSVELLRGGVFEIQIPKPGTLKLTHDKLRGKVTMQNLLGQYFFSFKTIELNEIEMEQIFELQPGSYKLIVETERGPKTISEFIIKSSETTEIHLL